MVFFLFYFIFYFFNPVPKILKPSIGTFVQNVKKKPKQTLNAHIILDNQMVQNNPGPNHSQVTRFISFFIQRKIGQMWFRWPDTKMQNWLLFIYNLSCEPSAMLLGRCAHAHIWAFLQLSNQPKLSDPAQELLLTYDFSDFDFAVLVGARRAGLHVSETAALLGFSHKLLNRVYTEWCGKQKTHPMTASSEGGNTLLMREVRGDSLVWVINDGVAHSGPV